MKNFLIKAVSANKKDWVLELAYVLWAYITTFKKMLRTSTYIFVYGKVCHLPIELEYKAWWAIKKLNFELQRARLKRSLDLNEIEEIKRKPIQIQNFILIRSTLSNFPIYIMSLFRFLKGVNAKLEKIQLDFFMRRRQPGLKNSLG